MYNATWFRGMPLTAREILSVLYNNALGLFADNWADCVAHAKWLTNMYLSDLAAEFHNLSGDFAEVRTALSSGYFVDDETTIIPVRFKANAEQASALIDVLQRRYPDDTVRLEAARQRYLQTAETYYFKSMLMAMTISVVGAGKSLPGDSTHFTFAAGETDFTLAVTLLDLKRHPLYHVWELLFNGAYAMVAGLWLANIASRQKSFDVRGGSSPFYARCVTSLGRSLRSDTPGRRVETCCSRASPCATSWAYSLARIDDFAQLTAFCG